jgi:dihydrofolate synthase / folylpolyglutamate synthase
VPTHGGAASADYRAAVSALAARTTQGVRLGLDRTRELARRCGSPHEKLRVFHVAGTNGKGSTCATLEAVLRAMGYRVARYSSPHLIDFTERILIDGAAVAPERVLRWLRDHSADIDALGATFFEATTVMAFDLFAEAGVDVAVIEVGLGGRLDSTNIVTPIVAAVTAIGLDHREFLGDTPAEIAREKAGIYKPGRPAVIGDLDAAVIDVLAGVAEAAGASPVVIARDRYPVESVRLTPEGTSLRVQHPAGALEMTSSLFGQHQAQNVVTALATLEAAGAAWTPDRATLRAGVSATRLSGRFQRRDGWIFDVAHNPDGIATVTESLGAAMPVRPLGAVVCVLADKDWRAMLTTLLPHLDALWLTHAPTAPANRVWPLADVVTWVQGATGGRRVRVTVEPSLDAALAAARASCETVLVTGSFHTVGDAMERLQIDPLAG